MDPAIKMAAPGPQWTPGPQHGRAIQVLHSPSRPVDENAEPVPGPWSTYSTGHRTSLVGEGFTGRRTAASSSAVSGRRDVLRVRQLSAGGEPRRILGERRVNSPRAVTVGSRSSGGRGAYRPRAYPVLTEEVSTTGIPAPAPVAGLAAAGAGYGQVVDQAMRDVLGWRPGGDVSGFQAALTGAFQLREVEGHTVWTWQQRGYAVQADMGALTGAQASIYARAKSALDQILPLLASLTPSTRRCTRPRTSRRYGPSSPPSSRTCRRACAGGRPPDPAGGRALPPVAREGCGSKNLNPRCGPGQSGHPCGTASA